MPVSRDDWSRPGLEQESGPPTQPHANSRQVTSIPFNRPHVTGREQAYLLEAIGNHAIGSDGKFSRLCEQQLRALSDSGSVVLTSSCTAALEMAALLIGIGPGDEVILPSFTFPSTANAFLLRGARVVFVDIEADTLSLDVNRVAEAITPRTRAIVAVHYAGVPCDMAALVAIGRQHDLWVIEDAAQALLSARDGRPAGSLADLATFSFHSTKNISCGEGGALAINHPGLLEKALVLRDKGTNRQDFLAGRIEKYTWVGVGSSCALGELPAAYLHAQLEQAQQITDARRQLWQHYADTLAPLATPGRVLVPVIPAGVRHNGHSYYLLMQSREERDRLIRTLKAADIEATTHYEPLHLAPAGRPFAADRPLPLSESLPPRLVRLPLWPGLPADTAEKVGAMLAALIAAP